MITLTSQVDALVSDARRAAVPGAIGDSPDHPGSVLVAPSRGTYNSTAPSGSPLSVAIDGPGLFVLDTGGQRVYGRLGDFRVDDSGVLVDGAGRTVMGFPVPNTSDTNTLQPVHVSDTLRKRFERYAIDDRGVVTGIVEEHDRYTGARVENATPLGRVALAIFQAPGHLRRVADTVAAPTAASGPPLIYAPGDPNIGRLLPHALENGLVDLEDDLARLWSLQRRGMLQARAASVEDSCSRTVMGLIK